MDPCGRAVDVVRACATYRVRPWRDSSDIGLIRTYRVAPGTEAIPFAHVWMLPEWQEDDFARDPVAGQVGLFSRGKYSKGEPFPCGLIKPSKRPCGSLRAWQGEGMRALDPPLEWQTAGPSTCCRKYAFWLVSFFQPPADPCAGCGGNCCDECKKDIPRGAPGIGGGKAKILVGFNAAVSASVDVVATFPFSVGFNSAVQAGTVVSETLPLSAQFNASVLVPAKVNATFPLSLGFAASIEKGFELDQKWQAKVGFTATVSSGSGSSPPTRTALGTTTSGSSGVSSLTSGSVTVEHGSMLIVIAAGVNSAGNPSFTWNGLSSTLAVSDGLFASSFRFGRLAILYVVNTGSTASATITVSWPAGTGPLMFEAVKVAGLASNVVDATAQADSTTGTPDSTATGTTTAASEYVQAAILLRGPTGGSVTFGTWASPWTDGSQNVTCTSTNPMGLQEGYQIASATGTFDATVSGTSGESWAAVVATFK